jgi:hypothetical protein
VSRAGLETRTTAGQETGGTRVWSPAGNGRALAAGADESGEAEQGQEGPAGKIVVSHACYKKKNFAEMGRPALQLHGFGAEETDFSNRLRRDAPRTQRTGRTMRLLIFSILVVFGATLRAQPEEVLSGTDRFHQAFFEASASDPANEVSFEPFQEINWEAKARTSLTWLNLDRPTPGQIARLRLDEGGGRRSRWVEFRAPLDPAAGAATYLLIYATGIVPIQPVQLKGSVYFTFDRSISIVKERLYSGVVVAKPEHPVAGAAFAIVGKPADVQDVDPGVKFVRRKQAGSAVYDFTDGSRTIVWATSSRDCSGKAASEYDCLDAESALSFSLAGQHLLLVKWKDAFCDSAYTLFSVDTTLKPIAGNEYGCDI